MLCVLKGLPWKKWLMMLAAASVLGLVCTVLTWPGVFYTDSYGRWQMARDLTLGNLATQDDWLSVPPQLFMAAAYKLFGGRYGAYTMVQAVAFFFTAFFAIDAYVPGKGRWPAWALFAACPVFYGFSVYLEMSAGCVTALLWLLWLLLCVDHSRVKQWKAGFLALYFFACCLLYFVMLGWRQNAFTVLPVLVFGAALLAKRAGSWRPVVLHVASAALALGVISAIPGVLRFGYQNHGASGSVGFLWETVSMLGELQDKPEYDDYLDDIAGAGATQKAVEANSYLSIYGYHQHIPNSLVGQGDNADRVMAKYVGLILKEPGTYLKVKTQFWAYTMGMAQPLRNVEYEYDQQGRMGEFGLRDTPARHVFVNSYNGFLNFMAVLRMPWLVFCLVLALLLVARRTLAKTARYRLWMLYVAAVFYYGSFLVTTQSQEFRYFFVPLVLLYLVGAACLSALCGRLTARRQNHPLEETA